MLKRKSVTCLFARILLLFLPSVCGKTCLYCYLPLRHALLLEVQSQRRYVDLELIRMTSNSLLPYCQLRLSCYRICLGSALCFSTI